MLGDLQRHLLGDTPLPPHSDLKALRNRVRSLVDQLPCVPVLADLGCHSQDIQQVAGSLADAFDVFLKGG